MCHAVVPYQITSTVRLRLRLRASFRLRMAAHGWPPVHLSTLLSVSAASPAGQGGWPHGLQRKLLFHGDEGARVDSWWGPVYFPTLGRALSLHTMIEADHQAAKVSGKRMPDYHPRPRRPLTRDT